MKKLLFGAVAAIGMVASGLGVSAMAAPLTVAGIEFEGGLDAFPTSVAIISGATDTFGGIGCAEGLKG